MGGAALKRGLPPVGAIGQFPDPVFAGNPVKTARRRRRKTRDRFCFQPLTDWVAWISGAARLRRKLPLPFPATPLRYPPPLPPAATPCRRPLAPRTPFWRKLRQTRAGRALSPRWPALGPRTPFNAKHGPIGGSTPHAARPAARFGKISLAPPPCTPLPPAARFWGKLLAPTFATPGRPLLAPRTPSNAEHGPAGGSGPPGGRPDRP